MKATAIAPANIAFIKYWGRKDARLRIPYNPSISMNLSNCTTTTTVEFSKKFSEDSVSEGFNTERIITHIDRLRNMAKTDEKVHVITKNNFPTSTGIASSASGFAALTVAAAAALGLSRSEKELTELARLGSGSAARSIPDGFVKWEGEFAYSLYPPDYWDLRDIIVIVQQRAKDVSSSAGHDAVNTSPFFAKRLAALPARIKRLEEAFRLKNFQKLGEVIEEDCLDMHHVMQTQNPPLYYWNHETENIMELVKKRTVPAYFTIDAGPNVHVICEGKNENKLVELLKGKTIIINKPARGGAPHMIPTHIAIIMDGNRRWARQRKLPVLEGHRRVANYVLERLVEQAARRGIKYMTFWAFSTENWGRAESEVKGIMGILAQSIKPFGRRMMERGVRLLVIGDLTRIDPKLQNGIAEVVEKTKNNTRITVTIALNYGGRDEIRRAVHKGKEDFENYLDTVGIPDPDFIIRTGGEQRLSGFLLWQSEYSELYFPTFLMPEFTPERLDEAIEEFASRKRRFGR